MTELSFLIELLLNHELPKPTKDLIASRIKEVEERLNSSVMQKPHTQTIVLPNGTTQAPSTLALMAKHGDPLPVPPEAIAQTPVTQAAVAAREAIMQGRTPDQVPTGKGTRGPRKW